MSKLLRITLVVVSLVAIFAATVQPAAALFSNSKKDACQGAALDPNATCDATSGSRLQDVLRSVITVFSIVVGIFAVIMLVIGGLKFILSQGDAANITSARNTILYAIIGLVIVLFSQFIVRFVLTKATGCPPGQVVKNGICANP